MDFAAINLANSFLSPFRLLVFALSCGRAPQTNTGHGEMLHISFVWNLRPT